MSIRRLLFYIATAATGATTIGLGTIGYKSIPPKPTPDDDQYLEHMGLEQIPSRSDQLTALKTYTKEKPLDILVIGGGATGSATALDASLRGLQVGLVERDDFASGTSSRSTKLIHGGVRYLEKAFFQMDPAQLNLVFEALRERAIMLSQAPHLTNALPTFLPCYKLWEVPFYWAGLKAYDLVAVVGSGLLQVSKFVPSSEARRVFPTLNRKTSDGKKLKGTIVYYDGQMDDARFNVSLGLTAAIYGAKVANHTEVRSLIRDEAENKIIGVRARDVFTGDEFDVHAKSVINATGPFTDGVRRMENPDANSMIVPSAGVHITLPSYYSPDGLGLIVPKTKDGRVVFMLPWLGRTIAGTTDSSVEITALPQPHEDEIGFILNALQDYLGIDVRRKDVTSAWSGIRPLAVNPDADSSSTQNILREHAVHVSPEKLITITGGKWTTQRKMAEDVVDKAIQLGGLSAKATKCKTPFVKLVGAHKWDEAYFTFLAQRYERVKYSAEKQDTVSTGLLEVDCAKHLSRAYGDQAYRVAELAERGLGRRLANDFPILEAEVVYAVQNEYCMTAIDFLARRSRLVFLDASAAEKALPKVVELMGTELKWDKRRCKEETDNALKFISTFSSGKVNGEK